MSKQNVYDNPIFFDNFKALRESEINFNDCIETPILMSLLPELTGKAILDIGCGMGQHAKQYAEMGAASVLGVDLSEKMLSYAVEHNAAANITYRLMAMEDIDALNQRFDVITSSLVFDYIEDFDDLLRKIHRLLNENGQLVFSTSHPMATAYDGAYPRFTRAEDGTRLYANIRNYCMEGKREITWVVDGYELYHRTLESMINALIHAGFQIEECRESKTTEELRNAAPNRFDGTVHRPDFIFFRCGKRGR